MNTDENWRDEHDRKYQQWESDKSGTTSQVAEYYKHWKAGALSHEDTECCQTFFDKGTIAHDLTSCNAFLSTSLKRGDATRIRGFWS